MVDTRFFVHRGSLSIAKIAEICGAELKTAGRVSTIARKGPPAPKLRLRPALPRRNWPILWQRA